MHPLSDRALNHEQMWFCANVCIKWGLASVRVLHSSLKKRFLKFQRSANLKGQDRQGGRCRVGFWKLNKKRRCKRKAMARCCLRTSFIVKLKIAVPEISSTFDSLRYFFLQKRSMSRGYLSDRLQNLGNRSSYHSKSEKRDKMEFPTSPRAYVANNNIPCY